MYERQERSYRRHRSRGMRSLDTPIDLPCAPKAVNVQTDADTLPFLLRHLWSGIRFSRHSFEVGQDSQDTESSLALFL